MSHPRNMHQGIAHQLRDKYAKIEQEIEALREVMRQDRGLEPDVADQACTASAQDWNMLRYNRNVKLLKDIAVALKAIDNDSYGVCELCGDDIPDRRLLAIPSARLCVECQEMMDAHPGEFGRTGIGGGVQAAV